MQNELNGFSARLQLYEKLGYASNAVDASKILEKIRQDEINKNKEQDAKLVEKKPSTDKNEMTEEKFFADDHHSSIEKLYSEIEELYSSENHIFSVVMAHLYESAHTEQFFESKVVVASLIFYQQLNLIL